MDDLAGGSYRFTRSMFSVGYRFTLVRFIIVVVRVVKKSSTGCFGHSNG